MTIQAILADPAQAQTLATAGRARVEAAFDLRTNVAELRQRLVQAAS